MKAISPQERHVLVLICKGYSTRKIALVLNVSFHTVQTYRRSLMNKYNATNAVDLVLKAARDIDLSDFKHIPN